MIELVTGTPGAGKTYYALRRAVQAADQGKAVITNVELVEDFARKVARRHPVRWLIPGRRRRVEDRIASNLVVTRSLEELQRVRVRGRGEGRGVVILDEGAGFLNARSWSDGDRRDLIAWFTQHRKLGVHVILIVQDADMIDKQVRALVEVEIRLRNLRRARVYGLPLAPFNLFLAVHRWPGGNGITLRRELYRLGWQKALYDTFEVIHDLEGDEGAIVLPRLPVTDPGGDEVAAEELAQGEGDERAEGGAAAA